MLSHTLEFGVIFPTKDIGADRRSLLDFGPRADQIGQWSEAGATHIAIGSSHDCYTSAEQYFDELRMFTEAIRP